MCAIFGTVGISDLELIKKISKKQLYRGPDSQNFFTSNDKLVCLGNNRLSVIDKENGKQPMFSSDKKFVTVFNGCIYNFLEIKKYLINKNINFLTNSDTEVVANAYMYFGKKVFNFFDGMWAIAIYDQEKKEIILSRDYVGQKPLFYIKNKNYYLFSSQLNGITEDQNSSRELSKNNLKKYFTYSFVPAPNTIFQNIYQLEPGENIFLKPKTLQIERKKYWDLKSGPDFNIFFKNETQDNFKREFDKVINQHYISDKVPAVSLSGGIDSNLITNHLLKSKKKLTSFTLGFENQSYNEAEYVKNSFKNLDKKIFQTKQLDFEDNFKELSKFLNEPFGDSSIVPTYIIQKKIKRFSNVSLGGDGGDETFFGYIVFDAFYLALKLKKFFPSFIFKSISKIVNLLRTSDDYLPFSTRLKKFFNTLHYKYEFLLPSWMGSITLKDFKKLFDEDVQTQEIYKDVENLFHNEKNLMRISQLYFFKFYLPMVLIKVDQASMYNSVESRAPFLSKRIINFSLNNDTNDLYKPFKKKYFLKNFFKNDLSSKVFSRKKHGFAFPRQKLLKNKKIVMDMIDEKYLINKDFFKSKYEDFVNNKEDNSQYIWNELILNISLQNLLSAEK